MSGINLGVLGFAGMVGLSSCAYGCGDSGADGQVNAAEDAGDEAADGSPSDVVSENDADAGETGSDPSIRPGFNGKFSDPEYGVGCSVVDIDVAGNQITGMCGPTINRMFRINLNASDAMASADANISSQSGLGAQPNLDPLCQGDGAIVPAQIAEVSGGSHIVPFNVVCPSKADGSPMLVKSGIAFLDAAKNDESTVSTIGEVKIGNNPDNEITFPLAGNYSAAIVGDKIYFTSSERIAYGGMFLSTAFMPNNYNVNYVANRVAAFTSGSRSAAMAMLDDTHALVLNAGGGDVQHDSSQLTNASLDIVNVTSTDAATSKAIGANRIDLGVKCAGLPFEKFPMEVQPYETPFTPDGNFVLTPGGDCTTLGQVIISSVKGALGKHGVYDVSPSGNIRGIAVNSDHAYVSVDDGSSSVSSGKVIVLDISNPDDPRNVGEPIVIGHDLGAIAVHESGIVYVSVTDRWWEPASDLNSPDTTRWGHIVAFDPTAASRPPADDGGPASPEGVVDGGGVK